MKKLCLSVLIGFLLSGCAANDVLLQESGAGTIDSSDHSSDHSADYKLQPHAVSMVNGTVNHWAQQPINLSQSFDNEPAKNINDYVRGIMHALVDNLQYVNAKTPIGVTSFVFIDSDLGQTSILGHQIAESFIHEIHQFGVPVIDFKMMDSLRVTREGDFIFSRDYRQLTGASSIEYILTGTLALHQAGYLVNARIIGAQSKAVVASAQGFIPSRVADAIIERDSEGQNARDGAIFLIQG